MSNLFDHFQTLSTREGTSVNESFICCTKCFNHGKNKIFSRSNVKELKSHLLEFHAIVADVEGEPKREFSGETKPRIMKYFETGNDGGLYCNFCKAEDVSTRYSNKSSATAMKRHLEMKHGFLNGDSELETKKMKISAVWKFFCKPTKHGKVVDEEYVYCGKCLESGKKLRYNRSTSTGTLKRHLQIEHGVDVNENETEKDIDKLVEGPKTQETKRCEANVIKVYYREDVNHFWCVICDENETPYKFSKNTSTTILKRHLVIQHQIDLFSDETAKKLEVTVPNDVLAKCEAIINKKLRKAKSYFIVIEEESDDSLFCAFCLVENRKLGYKKTTSETNLKRHLLKKHNFDHESTKDEDPEDLVDADPTIYEALRNQAKQVSMTKGLTTVKYFIYDPTETRESIYCVFCLINGRRQKYSPRCSSTNLRRHLRNKHNFDPMSSEGLPEHFSDKEAPVLSGPDPGSSDSDGEIPTYPVHSVMLETLVTPQHAHDTNYCRSCGEPNLSFSTKFSSNLRINDYHPETTLGKVYTEITGVQIFEDDGMSQAICYRCEANLKTAYHFKTNAVKTEREMARKFNIDPPIDIKDEPPSKRQKLKVEYVEDYLEDE